MFIISYIHELFNEQKCQEYIHKLRWKDRPFICPRCENDNIKNWGKYHRKKGLKRYRCKKCKRTFNDLTNTLLDGCKLPIQLILLVVFLMLLVVAFVSAGNWVSISKLLIPAYAGTVLVVQKCCTVL
jgi:transposase-like protein